MKIITLFCRRECKVDDELFDKLSETNWRYNRPYAITGYRETQIFMHRVIKPDVPEGLFIDHAGGDGLNNQRSNLRLCTHSQNHANRKIASNNTSGYKGVFFDKESGKWRAQIKVNQKPIRLGRFINIDDAARAYNEAALKHFGEFAKTNEIGKRQFKELLALEGFGK